MLVYPSGIDLSSSTLRHLSHLLATDPGRGTRWRQLSAVRQALLALAHLRCGHSYAQLAARFSVGIATVYRYIAEAVEVLAPVAPDLTAATLAAASKGNLFNRTLGQLNHCLQKRKLFEEETAFPTQLAVRRLLATGLAHRPRPPLRVHTMSWSRRRRRRQAVARHCHYRRR